MGKKKSFLGPFSDAKVWLHWIILASVITFFIINIREQILRINLDEISAILIYLIAILTIIIAIFDVIIEKVLGI